MRRIGWCVCATGLMLASTAGEINSQPVPGGVPAVPGVTAPGVPGVPGAGALAGAAPKAGFFKRVCAGLDECRRKICGTPAGQLLNSATRPVGALTGGVFPSFCPLMPSDKDLQKPGVSGTAAAAQKEALEAKQRREAVRFLGTVDCRYFPDASVALAAALRTDSSECVRYEAALVLGRGCCCTEKTVRALMATVSGAETDGNPAERSVRVRCAAAVALERCLMCYVPPPMDVEIQKIIEKPPPAGEVSPMLLPGTTPLPAPKPVAPGGSDALGANRMPKRETVEQARQILNEFQALLAAQPPAARAPGAGAGRQSVYHLLKDSMGDMSVAQPMPVVVTAPAEPVPRPAVFQAPTAQRPALPLAHEPVKVPQPPAVIVPTPPTALRGAAPGDVVVASAVVPAVSAPPADPTAELSTRALYSATSTERLGAMRELVRLDWRQHPMVASVMVQVAKADADSTVRVEALRHMVSGKMAHPQVLTELAALMVDRDQSVREEAARALAQLKP